LGLLNQTPLGEFTALPRPPSWILWPTSKEREGRGSRRRDGKERREERKGTGKKKRKG